MPLERMPMLTVNVVAVGLCIGAAYCASGCDRDAFSPQRTPKETCTRVAQLKATSPAFAKDPLDVNSCMAWIERIPKHQAACVDDCSRKATYAIYNTCIGSCLSEVPFIPK